MLNLDNVSIYFLPKSTNQSITPYPTSDLQARFDKLKNNNQERLLYIGKGENLHKRIKQYINFGLNKVKNHKGGRLIFQIEKYEELYIEILFATIVSV